MQMQRWSRMTPPILVLSLLAACASNPSSQEPALSRRPDAPHRAALLAAAENEWHFFGGQQIDMRHEPLSAPRLGLLEDEGEAVQRVGLYWQSVGRNYTGADSEQPWSAAFISYLMQTAGVAADDFLPNEDHFSYLSFLKQRQNEPDPLFVLRPAASTAVVPGDLICTARDNNMIDTIAEIHPGVPGHCDLVFEVHAQQGWAGVIGGNVYNSVSESLIPLSPAGMVTPIERRRWFVVVKNLMP